jgi:hypothetical protein
VTQIKQRIRPLADFFFRSILAAWPLALRKPLVVVLNRLPFVSPSSKEDWTFAVLRDVAGDDSADLNRFMWANHLGPAAGFEASRFAPGVEPSRQVFFTELEQQLLDLGVEPSHDVGSVLEVGSSVGVNLRHLEQGLFADVGHLEGIDIDAEAVRKGTSFLSKAGSRVKLQQGDMSRLDEVLHDQQFDVVLCTGVLMYVPASMAEQVIDAMIRHSRHLVAMSEPWDPGGPHIREDGAHYHDLEALVREAGGRVVAAQRRPNLHYGVSHQFVFAKSA